MQMKKPQLIKSEDAGGPLKVLRSSFCFGTVLLRRVGLSCILTSNKIFLLYNELNHYFCKNLLYNTR
jgi:hypothetical protein